MYWMMKDICESSWESFVDIRQHIPFNIENLNIPQKVHYPCLQKEILDTYKDEHDIFEALKERRKELSPPKHIHCR